MYQPTSEQAEADRKLAYERGVPHGMQKLAPIQSLTA